MHCSLLQSDITSQGKAARFLRPLWYFSIGLILVTGYNSQAFAETWMSMPENITAGPDCARGCDGVCDSGLTYSSCGICGGDEIDCDPTTDISECQYFDVNGELIMDSTIDDAGEMFSGSAREEFAGLRCIERWMEDWCNVDTEESLTMHAINKRPYQDDCVWNAVFVGAIGVLDEEGDNRTAGEDQSVDIVRASAVIDEDCNVIDHQVEAEEMCGDATVRTVYSPISLIWEEGADIDSKQSIVEFPLNPHASGRWYTWKASAQTPLLVYDPARTGAVRSAEQLFGHWTFGGKRFASAQVKSAAAPKSSAWQDGYEALSSLDRNMDGAVDGAELAGLALWFDKNQDGRSDPGEVRTLEETGVVRLFYQSDYTDPLSKNIYAVRGYERVVDGKRTFGSSVDWFAESAGSQHELAARELLRAKTMPSEELENNPITGKSGVEPPPSGNSDFGAVGSRSGFLGQWIWKPAATPHESAPAGLLTLRSEGGSKISGRSYLFNEVTSRDGRKLIHVKAVRLTGTIQNRHGRETIRFTLHDAEGVITESSAKLEDGALHGQSFARYTRKPAFGGKKGSLKYKWIAVRR